MDGDAVASRTMWSRQSHYRVQTPLIDLPALYPANGMVKRVTVTLTGGRRISAEVIVPRGHPLNPMSREDVESKFLSRCQDALGIRRAKASMAGLMKVEDEHDLGGLLGRLTVRLNQENRS